MHKMEKVNSINVHIVYSPLYMLEHIHMTTNRLTWCKQPWLAVRWQSVHDEVSLHLNGADFMHPCYHFISQRSEVSSQPSAGVQALITTLHTQKHIQKTQNQGECLCLKMCINKFPPVRSRSLQCLQVLSDFGGVYMCALTN